MGQETWRDCGHMTNPPPSALDRFFMIFEESTTLTHTQSDRNGSGTVVWLFRSKILSEMVWCIGDQRA
jgi:hypothetical protein